LKSRRLEMGRDAEKEKFWREKMVGYKKSGLTAREFCEQNQLSGVQFHYWRRALRKDDSRKNVGFVELVRPGSGNGTSGVRLQIGNGISIDLDRGFDEATLKAALVAVAERA
jgi:hypothetical protein